MRVAKSQIPGSQSLPADRRPGRASPPTTLRSGGTSNGAAERITGPSFGVGRMLALYLENETPYAPPVLSSFHLVA